MNRILQRFFGLLILGSVAGCGQNLDKIRVPHPQAATIQLQCAVQAETRITEEQAFCLAKLAGLQPGVRRWGIHVYEETVDVYNTLADAVDSPASGVSVRIQRVGGKILSQQPWAEVQVD